MRLLSSVCASVPFTGAQLSKRAFAGRPPGSLTDSKSAALALRSRPPCTHCTTSAPVVSERRRRRRRNHFLLSPLFGFLVTQHRRGRLLRATLILQPSSLIALITQRRWNVRLTPPPRPPPPPPQPHPPPPLIMRLRRQDQTLLSIDIMKHFVRHGSLRQINHFWSPLITDIGLCPRWSPPHLRQNQLHKVWGCVTKAGKRHTKQYIQSYSAMSQSVSRVKSQGRGSIPWISIFSIWARWKHTMGSMRSASSPEMFY